jgi:antibiotic biosynthesis monooxygenase (ABM) superfamily enzyme
MVIAPLTLIVGFALGPLLGDVPLVPATYLRAGIVVLLMTYLVMPFARRVLARWLDS